MSPLLTALALLLSAPRPTPPPTAPPPTLWRGAILLAPDATPPAAQALEAAVLALASPTQAPAGAPIPPTVRPTAVQPTADQLRWLGAPLLVAVRVPDQGDFLFAHLASPRPAEALEDPRKRSLAAILDDAPLPAHASQLIVHFYPAPSPSLGPIPAMRTFVRALAGLAATTRAAAIALDDVPVVHPATYFAESVKAGAFAHLAVALFMARDHGYYTLSSQGLARLGRREIDLDTRLGDVGYAITFFYDLVTWLTDRDTDLAPGETVGRNAAEHLTPTAHTRDGGVLAWRLGVQGPPPALPRPTAPASP